MTVKELRQLLRKAKNQEAVVKVSGGLTPGGENIHNITDHNSTTVMVWVEYGNEKWGN